MRSIPRRIAGVICVCLLVSGAHARGEDMPQEGGKVKIRVACAGDSITQGFGLADPVRESYPSRLQELLGDGYEVGNFGISGATVLNNAFLPYKRQAEYRAALGFRPQIVVLLLGTNDAFALNWLYADDFEEDYRELSGHFGDLEPKPEVFVCLPPPIVLEEDGGPGQLVGVEIPRIIRKIASEKGFKVIDLHAALSGRPEFFPDGVHPDAEGARAIAGAVFGALSEG